MDFQGSQMLAMPLQDAWNFLADVSNVVSCVPGFQKLDQVAANEWRAAVGISVGFVRASLPVKITCSLVEEEQRHIAFNAAGKASGSSVEMSGDMTLVAAGNGETRMDWKSTVNVGGLLARLPAGVLTGTMERGSSTFFATLAERMTSSVQRSSHGPALPQVITDRPSSTSRPSSAILALPAIASPLAPDHFMWRWPWYLIAGLAAIEMAFLKGGGASLAGYGLLIFALLALLIMLFERTPEALIAPAGLAALAISRFHVNDASISLLVYSLLCVLIFASRFLWKNVTAGKRLVSPAWFPVLLALGGQFAVICMAIADGSLTSHTSSLIYAGAATLLVFTLLVLWSGYLLPDRPVLRRWCYYCAGFLIGLCISWYLLSFPKVRSYADSYEFFTIAPAVSLSVIAPFLMRDQTLPGYRQIGQVIAILATIALLFPTALSLSQNQILVVLFLLEAVALFLLGLITRTQVFIYGGATLVVLGVFVAFLFFIYDGQNTVIIVSVAIYAIICVTASIFFVLRDRRQKK
jgi:carbon monoxide dehydrogenase subunit G